MYRVPRGIPDAHHLYPWETGLFPEDGLGILGGPAQSGLLEDTQPCGVPGGRGHQEERAPRADLGGVNGVRGSGLAVV